MLQKRQIIVKGARVSLEILWIIELQRIDEDTDHDEIVLLTASLHKRGVATMEGSHRRYKADAASSQSAPPVPPVGQGAPNPHHE
jgi:hypothetical protein